MFWAPHSSEGLSASPPAPLHTASSSWTSSSAQLYSEHTMASDRLWGQWELQGWTLKVPPIQQAWGRKNDTRMLRTYEREMKSCGGSKEVEITLDFWVWNRKGSWCRWNESPWIRFSLFFFWYQFGSLCISRDLSISSRLSNLLMYNYL